MQNSKPTIGNIFGHLVEMNKSQQEAHHQLQKEIRGLVELNKTQLEGSCQLQEQIRGLVEMNKSQQDRNHHLQEQICGLVKMNKSQQEGFHLLQQQVYEIQGTILKALLHQQPEMRHQVTGEEVPGLSTGPLENSTASDNYRRREEYTEYVEMEMEDNWNMFKQDSMSAVINKLLEKNRLHVICKKTEGVFYKDKIAVKGSPSIFCKGVWVFPGEFEFLSGNEKSKNWKKSIYINMKKLKNHLNMSDAELSKFRKITLSDLFKQSGVKLPNQKMRRPKHTLRP
ncbi:uncharacterized protein LOC114661935 [Erpetoichthys calabaricus]|uniref:uncharacterized protein LOC114661935 n=1 Tax=Erpetoichthys calabaricus TaxID=27687 RepID=UPI0022341152|nr:uncharacterized protein LOC114661935 [Erpetoichthys calabaricus]